MEECFADPKKLIYKAAGGAYVLIGKTLAGEILQIAFRREPKDMVFIFHAMIAKLQDQRKYKRRGK